MIVPRITGDAPRSHRTDAGRVVWALVVGLSIGNAAQVDAQLYTWRDDHGRLVVSDVPTPDAPTRAVPGTARVRTTRTVVEGRSATRFEELIQRSATREGVSPDLVRAVIQVESGFDPRARSSAGALGLMQLMPSTAAELGVTDPFDPEQNVRGGTRYLRQLLTRFDGNEELALAAYNAGPGSVARHGNRVPPFPETRTYLQRVRSSAARPSIPAARRAVAPPPPDAIYRSWQRLGDRSVPLYTNTPSTGLDYQVVTER